MALSYKDKTLAKVCRCPKDKSYKPKTPEEWVEWQADNLAAAILMPSAMFKKRIEELKKAYKTGKKLMILCGKDIVQRWSKSLLLMN